jgi:hypothetical protein
MDPEANTSLPLIDRKPLYAPKYDSVPLRAHPLAGLVATHWSIQHPAEMQACLAFQSQQASYMLRQSVVAVSYIACS